MLISDQSSEAPPGKSLGFFCWGISGRTLYEEFVYVQKSNEELIIDMSFIALLPVRDEADIIGQSLRHALAWADAIYVFDSGSVDNTWEIVLDLASREKRVKPIRKEPVYFSDTRVRGFLFHYARQFMRDGDWFLRIDADEFHHIPPPEFAKPHLRKGETIA